MLLEPASPAQPDVAVPLDEALLDETRLVELLVLQRHPEDRLSREFRLERERLQRARASSLHFAVYRRGSPIWSAHAELFRV